MTTSPTIPESPPLDQAKRSEGVGASEIAAVMGLSDNEDAFTVYAKKTGEIVEDQGPQIDVGPRRWGAHAESELLRVYVELTGRQIIRPGTLSHPERPWQLATPDGLCITVQRGVECKTAGVRMAHKWGDPDEPNQGDRIPTEYFLQCQYGMSVCRAPYWDVPALIGGNDFRLYSIAFDAELEEMMLEAARDFVERYLRPRIPPPIGWTPKSSEWVKRKYPSSGGGMIEANREHVAMAEQLYVLTRISGEVERRLEQTKNEIKAAIGDFEGLAGIDWRINWRCSKDSTRVDWEAVAGEYRSVLALIASSEQIGVMREAARDAISETVKRHLSTKPGYRSFRPNLPDSSFYLTQGKKVFKALMAIRPLIEERKDDDQ